jgi:hypothetical protein
MVTAVVAAAAVLRTPRGLDQNRTATPTVRANGVMWMPVLGKRRGTWRVVRAAALQEHLGEEDHQVDTVVTWVVIMTSLVRVHMGLRGLHLR